MKRNSKGFTLVELLVVMAIISILAAIAVPNAIKYIAKGRAVKALADISSIQSGLVSVLADTGRSSLMQLFNTTSNPPTQLAVSDAIGLVPGQAMTRQQFEAAMQIYTGALLGILRDGRGAAVLDDTIPNASVTYSQVLNQNVCKKLGSSYVQIGFDPWGNLYNVYPGPWPSNSLVPFRKRYPESDANANGVKLPGKGDKADRLTVTIPDPDKPTNTLQVGFPAARDSIAFIWSNGANLVSSQAIYIPEGYGNPNADPANDFYDVAANQDTSFDGGGDDINNWDKGQSWSSFY